MFSSALWCCWVMPANEFVSQTRRCNDLRAVDQGLEKYSKEPPSNNQKFLFGKEFCSQLKAQVESDKTLSQVVQLSHRHKPYDQKARQTTLGHSKKHFFDKALLAIRGPGRAMLPPQQAVLQVTFPTAAQLPSSHSLGEIGKILSNLPLPHPSLQGLNLNMALLTHT